MSFRSVGRWFKPGLCRRVDSLHNKLYFSLFLFTQVSKWAPAIIMLGAGGGGGGGGWGGETCDGLASYAVGSSNIPKRFVLPNLIGLLARMQTLYKMIFI